MKEFQKKSCLILGVSAISERIESKLKRNYSILHAKTIDQAVFLIGGYLVNCIVVYINGYLETSPVDLVRLKAEFPAIPLIGVIPDSELESTEFCDYTIPKSNLSELCGAVELALRERGPDLSFDKYGIDFHQCSGLVQKALRILKERCLELKNVRELSNELGISLETLSREFRQYCNIGPKRVLMKLKIEYACHLMKNPGLSLKGISGLLGFSDVHRLNESFHHVKGVSPSEYRRRYDI